MKQIRCKDFLRLLPQNTKVCIRGAFQSGYGENDDRPNYYVGLISDIKSDFEYANYEVYCSYWWGKSGDVCKIEDAYAIDIALTDFEVENA